MKKNILVILLCIGVFKKTIAQHCVFDNSYIVVVQITAKNTKKAIHNLQVNALDSLNNPIEIDYKTVNLWENPTLSKSNLKRKNFRKHLHFNFAKDAYILITQKNKTHLIKKIEIKDIDGNSNIGKFKTKTIPLSQEKFFPLCSWNPTNQDFTFHPKSYKPTPIQVSLQNDTITTKKLSRNESLLYQKIIGNNQVSIFTGKEHKNEIKTNTYINSLLIRSIDSFSIKYRIENSINWHSIKNTTGIAKLDLSSINTNRWVINDKKGKKHTAFRFVEQKEKCEIEILISKNKPYNQSISIVNKICKNQCKPITVRMRYK